MAQLLQLQAQLHRLNRIILLPTLQERLKEDVQYLDGRKILLKSLTKLHLLLEISMR